MSNEEIPFQKRLLGFVKEVAQEEGFQIERLDQKYNQYYVSSKKDGHRCVDGRGILETYGDGSLTGYKNEGYSGDQFPGATLGIIEATRVVGGLDEETTRQVVKKTCDTNGIKMGGHIDDAQGEITTREELEARTRGCGNQDAAAEGRIPMYIGLVDRDVIDDRFVWLKENRGVVAILAGGHEEKLAAVNLETEKTFDTLEAVKDNESIFNADLVAAHELGGQIFDELMISGIPHQGSADREIFQRELVSEVIRDYMQTLVALGRPKKLSIHADPEVEI